MKQYQYLQIFTYNMPVEPTLKSGADEFYRH
jgi:hypothetical protein